MLVALLLKVEALVIVLESQPLVPPPFKFARAFSSDDPLEHGLTGCSLAYQLRILWPSYDLLVYTEQDTVFVHSKLLSLFESLPAGTLTSKIARSCLAPKSHTVAVLCKS